MPIPPARAKPRSAAQRNPGAVAFYEKRGARVVGSATSGSIAGRRIPLLSIDLDRAQGRGRRSRLAVIFE